MSDLKIDTVKDHGDTWTVLDLSGVEHEVPQDTTNRHARAVLAWITAGNLPESAEVSRKNRLRRCFREDAALKVILREFAEQQGLTQAQMMTKLLDHLN